MAPSISSWFIFETESLTKPGICQSSHTGSRDHPLSRQPHLAFRWVFGLTQVLKLGIKLRSSCFCSKDLVTESSPSLANYIFTSLFNIYSVWVVISICLGPGDGPKSRERGFASREVRQYTKYTIYIIDRLMTFTE